MPPALRLMNLFLAVFWFSRGLAKTGFSGYLPALLMTDAAGMEEALRQSLHNPWPLVVSMVEQVQPHAVYLHWAAAWLQMGMGALFLVVAFLPYEGAHAAKLMPWGAPVGMAMQITAMIALWGQTSPLPYLVVTACHLVALPGSYRLGWPALRIAMGLVWIWLGLALGLTLGPGLQVAAWAVSLCLLLGLFTWPAAVGGVALVYLAWPTGLGEQHWLYYAVAVALVALAGRSASRLVGVDGWLREQVPALQRVL